MVRWHSSERAEQRYNRWVNLNTAVHLFVRRLNGTISVGWSVTNANAPDPDTEIEVASGVFGLIQLKLAKDFYLPQTQPPQPPTSRISAVVTEWRTISGAPSFISVTTPVVDVGQPLKVTPTGYPAGMHWSGERAILRSILEMLRRPGATQQASTGTGRFVRQTSKHLYPDRAHRVVPRRRAHSIVAEI
jgi:hypothetical protein